MEGCVENKSTWCSKYRTSATQGGKEELKGRGLQYSTNIGHSPGQSQLLNDRFLPLPWTDMQDAIDLSNGRDAIDLEGLRSD